MYVEATSEQILAHNVELLLNRRDHLVLAHAGREREQVWRATCSSAVYQFESAAAVTRAGWEVPAALRHWLEV